MQRASDLPVLTPDELAAWPRPETSLLTDKALDRTQRAQAGLRQVMLGGSVNRAAKHNALCPKRLRHMAFLAPQLAPDGDVYGFRVCVAWGTYHRVAAEAAEPEEMPVLARPHAMAQLLAAQPLIREWVEDYAHPLPKRAVPRSFSRLHDRIVAELKRQNLGGVYPLNHNDKGRRALLRFIRRQREAQAVESLVGPEKPRDATTLADFFARRLYDRDECDAHRIDIEAVLGVPIPNGGQVRRELSTLWLIARIETDSRAITSWCLRVGDSYNNQDLATCLAGALTPWVRKTLTLPGLVYAPGAGMPCGLSPSYALRRTLLIAMDNAKAHHAHAIEQSFCRVHDGVLNTGRAYEPRSRPVVEQLFSRLEKGAFRQIPGGFEPAKRLGENKIRISNFSPDDCPVQLPWLEELIEVIITGYNATPHPALGDLSPLQYLKLHGHDRSWFYEATDGEECAADMDSVIVPVTVHGNRRTGDLPHINYAYVRYRNSELDHSWELVGKKLLAKVYRRDLRTIRLFSTATQPMGVVRAMRPWAETLHDETTRKLIFRWTRQGRLSLNGVDCAIAAYIAHLKATAGTQTSNELGRMQQAGMSLATPRPEPLRKGTGAHAYSEWISLDGEEGS